MKRSISLIISVVVQTVLATACAPASSPVPLSAASTLTPSPVPPTAAPELTATATSPPPSWEVYTNETWGFSLEHPTAWVVSDNDTQSGFIGKQVFWWVGNYDPMEQHGDAPAVDQVTDVDINGQPARRVLGHYLGAIGDMGYQQYLRYVMQKEDMYYVFTLFAVDALGVPSSMMTEPLPLDENDIRSFEQMMATIKFKE